MRLKIAIAVASGLAFCGSAIGQQEFPVKPVRIVTGAAGGSSDLSARLIAQGLTNSLGQQVIVDARPTLLSREIVLKSPPDGYTLLLTANSFYLAPLVQTTSYDPVRDFAPVSMAIRTPNIFIVHPSLPVKTVKEVAAPLVFLEVAARPRKPSSRSSLTEAGFNAFAPFPAGVVMGAGRR